MDNEPHALLPPDSGQKTEKSYPLQLPSLMIGGAVFSHHYNQDIDQIPTKAILSRAIQAGANGQYLLSLPAPPSTRALL